MGKGSGQSDDPAEEERRKKREENLTASPMTARRLALTMKRSQKMHPDIPYVFLLGAGCSRSSGILLASELVKDVWMPEIQKELELKPNEYPDGYDPDNPGAWYSSAVAHLFQTADRQQTEFARLTRDTRPGYGYYVFSELMATHKKQFSTVLTTNFDNLLVDALTFFQGAQPLVVYHSQLIRMATPEREHPAIIKLHNDVFYSPRNTQEDLSSLDGDLVRKVADLLRHRPLIIMGYSGNDPTVLKLLQACDTEMEVYWVGSSLPVNDRFRRWLTSDNVKAQWVKHGDFDRLMLEVAGVFEMKGGPDRRKVLKRLEDVEDHYRTVSSGLIDETRESSGDEDKPSEGAMAYLAYQEASQDPGAGDQVFKEALIVYPDSPGILGNYANFLQKQNRTEEAEEHYTHALKADQEHAINLGNYIEFLFLQDRAPEGEAPIEKLKGIKGTEKDASLLCVNFVALALHPKRANKDTLLQIKDAILAGHRRTSWNFEEVIEKARQDGHPDIALLSDLADVINEKQEPSILEEYEVWKKA